MTDCWSRFDAWMWEDTSEYTREQKATDYYKARGGDGSTKLLAFFRICCILFWVSSEANYWYIRESYWVSPFLFLTNWGWFAFVIYFVLITYAYFRHEVFGQAVPQDSSSLLQLWKWCQFFYEIEVVMSLLITLFFWTLVFPAFGDWTPNYNTYAKHAIPFGCMIVEFFMNKMAFEWNHWVGVVFLGSNYMVVLITFTLKTHWLYPFAKLDTVGSWLTLPVLLGFTAVTHFALYGLSKLKYNTLNSSPITPIKERATTDGKELILIILPVDSDTDNLI